MFQLLQHRITITACEEVLALCAAWIQTEALTRRVPRQGSVPSCLQGLDVSLATSDVTPLLTTS